MVSASSPVNVAEDKVVEIVNVVPPVKLLTVDKSTAYKVAFTGLPAVPQAKVKDEIFTAVQVEASVRGTEANVAVAPPTVQLLDDALMMAFTRP